SCRRRCRARSPPPSGRSPRRPARGPPVPDHGDPIERRVVGPGFHQQVYDVVRRVPRGSVTTYGDVATILGSPRVARHVGWALASLDEGRHADTGEEPVPWHRVINGRGRISYRGDTVRGALQRQLLEAEGVAFDPLERVVDFRS